MTIENKITEKTLDKVHEYLAAHLSYDDQPNSNARDAFVYHLVNIIIKSIN